MEAKKREKKEVTEEESPKRRDDGTRSRKHVMRATGLVCGRETGPPRLLGEEVRGCVYDGGNPTDETREGRRGSGMETTVEDMVRKSLEE